MLEVALGLFLKEQKIINCFQELGVTSSYDKVRRFKISAAHHASQDKNSKLDSKMGLVQGSSHNFDANLSTQNGWSKHTPWQQWSSNILKVSKKARALQYLDLRKRNSAEVKIQEPKTQVFKGEKAENANPPSEKSSTSIEVVMQPSHYGL